jgi:hypothetical protein
MVARTTIYRYQWGRAKGGAMPKRPEKICVTILMDRPSEVWEAARRGMYRNRVLNKLDSLLDKRRVEAGEKEQASKQTSRCVR